MPKKSETTMQVLQILAPYVIKMWSLKKKILPSKGDLPMAMKDSRGNILSDKKSILGLYKTEYIQRMSSKPPLPPYKECQLLKNQLFEYRMNIS